MLTRPDPDALLAGPLGDWLASQDGARDQARKRASTIQMTGIGLACIVAMLIVLAKGDVGAALQFGFFIGAGSLGIAEWSKRGTVRTIKGGINEAIAQSLDMEFVAAPVPGLEFERARGFQLLPGYERCSFEDQWRGKVGEHSFQLYEAHLEEERSSGKSRRWVTLFRGALITIGFARRFNGVTLVERAGRRKSFFGLLGDKDEITLDGIRLGRVDMVDPRFEDEFAVWSNDQVEARYLVHPEYVERLMAVEQAFAGEKVRALFQDGELLIVLESGNMFESGSLDASSDRALLQKTIDQFGTLVDLAVRLNERPR